jgi:hypothetical protein
MNEVLSPERQCESNRSAVFIQAKGWQRSFHPPDVGAVTSQLDSPCHTHATRQSDNGSTTVTCAHSPSHHLDRHPHRPPDHGYDRTSKLVMHSRGQLSCAPPADQPSSSGSKVMPILWTPRSASEPYVSIRWTVTDSPGPAQPPEKGKASRSRPSRATGPIHVCPSRSWRDVNQVHAKTSEVVRISSWLQPKRPPV